MKDFRGIIHIGMGLVLITMFSFGKLADYRFLECAGTDIANSVSSDLNGTLEGDASLVEGESALAFQNHGKMVVEHNRKLDLIGNLSIAFWVNPSEIKRQALIVRGEGEGNLSDRLYGSNAEYSLVLWEDGRFKYKHNQTADTYSLATIPQNEWTHIVLLRNSETQKISIYINGILDNVNSYTLPVESSYSEKLLIGTGESYSSTMNNFNGKIDEIKIYNIVLSESEIQSLFSDEKDGVHLESSCVASSEENTTTIVDDPTTTLPVVAPVTTTIVPTLSTAESTFSLGNKVWFDQDEDGLQSSEDRGVEGVMVALYTEDDQLVGESVTDEYGLYEFSNLSIGQYYLVFDNLPENYQFTLDNVGLDDGRDSDVDPRTGRTESFFLEGNDFSWDVGITFLDEENMEGENENNITFSIPPASVGILNIAESNESMAVSDQATEECVCDTYEESVPSLNKEGVVLMLLLSTLLAGLFLRDESI